MKLPTFVRRLALLTAAGAVTVTPLVQPAASEAAVGTTLKQRVTAARIAQSKVGRPYRWGATGPSSFDCSGLVSYAYRSARHALGARTSYDMWRLGRHVHRRGLRRGDIVFTWDRAHGHVGVYLGRGRYVHAPGSGRRVQIAPLPGGSGYVGAVRP